MSTTLACPLCGSDKRMKKPKKLYGHDVCKKCVGKFANRRQFAYVIDLLLAYILQIAVGIVIGFILAMSGLLESKTVVGVANLLLIVFFSVAFLAKDGFSGYSPGKALFGVRTINSETGAPIGLGASIKRTLPLFIPFMVLVVGYQLLNGHRIGDGWSQSKVIWNKYLGNPVFATALPNADIDFDQARVVLPPGQASSNPYQAPRQ